MLGVTSNEGALDFQFLEVNGVRTGCSEVVVDQVATWEVPTTPCSWPRHVRRVAEVRRRVPDHFLLVPGVGAQAEIWAR
ncbi:MAG: hypothetical protein R2810_00775 [Flavobacteriales bacterium]